MGLPAGVDSVTLTAGDHGLANPDGTAAAGTVTLTPSVERVVSSTHGLIVLGPANATLSASGTFTLGPVLATDADGFEPSGWTYRVDENFTGQPPRSYDISLPAAVPTVALPDVTPTSASPGTVVSSASVVSVNGHTGTVTGLLEAANNLSDLGSAVTARSNLGLGTAATKSVGTTTGTVAAGDDSRLSDARTPTAHAASHAAAGSDPVTLSQSQITGLLEALAALLPLAGGTVSGDLVVDGANLTVKRADDTGAYRLRVTGGGLDFEIGGLDVTISSWTGADFTGSQANVMRLEAAGPHLIGNTQFGTTPFDTVHSIDAGTGVAALGAKNSLLNIRFCGRRSSTGAPTTGTWAAGDTVQDSAGALWLCTSGGTPGTWSGAASQPWVFDVTASAYGAVGDGQVVADGAMTASSATLTSATAAFTADDVGKAVSVKGAAAAGVTTLVTTISAYVSSTQVTLADTAATTVSGAIVIWGTDDTAAIQAAVDAAEAYLAAGHGYAQVYFPPRPYIVAGALSNAKSGNGQIVFGPVATTGVKKILEFRGAADGAAAVRHWEQTVPQTAGSCLISLGVYSSTTAQTTSINADGNPAVICGPNEGSGYGVNSGGAVFSNMMAVVTNLAILTTHSAFGLTYGALNLWGCANAHIENVGYGTAGIVPGSDYSSPGTFGTGLSVGLLLSAPGNNDHVVARNVSCGGGYTYAMFLTEHAVVDRYMALYCWAGLVAVGTYAGSVGSVHSMHVTSASIEACTNELYIMGPGSQGVGPTIYANISTESSTPSIAGSSTGAMNAALGRVVLTGLFTESGVSVSAPTGLELVNGQVPRAIKRKTSAFTCSPIDRTLVCDTSSAGFTGTLPTADFNPVEYAFKNVGANTLTVATTSSQPIYLADGTTATSTDLANGDSLRVQALYDGSAWGWYAI